MDTTSCSSRLTEVPASAKGSARTGVSIQGHLFGPRSQLGKAEHPLLLHWGAIRPLPVNAYLQGGPAVHRGLICK